MDAVNSHGGKLCKHSEPLKTHLIKDGVMDPNNLTNLKLTQTKMPLKNVSIAMMFISGEEATHLKN